MLEPAVDEASSVIGDCIMNGRLMFSGCWLCDGDKTIVVVVVIVLILLLAAMWSIMLVIFVLLAKRNFVVVTVD